MNGAQLVVSMLKKRGVDAVSVLCGNGLDPFLDACLDYGMEVIDVRNEQAAAYMADTWGRMTRRLGVVAVSSGPGHTNAVTGVANAFWDGGPMLLISGCSELGTRGLDNFQELDQIGIVAPITKYANLVGRVDLLQHEVDTAITMATNGRPGPVHLTIPANVLLAEVDEKALISEHEAIAEVRPQGSGDVELVQRAADLLASAGRPFVVAGSGLFYADGWQTLRNLASTTDIPIVSHIWDRGCIEQAIPQYVGVTNDELNGAMVELSRSDVVVFAGARVDYRVGSGRPPAIAPDARIIRLDAEPSEINRARVPDVGIVGNPSTVLGQISAELGDVSLSSWLETVRASCDCLIDQWALADGEMWPLPGFKICREIKPFLERDVTFLLDGGNIGRWAHMLLFDRHPAHWFTCGASGVVGWGLPGAVAAKRARPDHPLLLLSGDGAAGFTIAEIETALRFGTPYVAVIAHDGAWGIVSDGQPEGRCVASHFGEIRFDRVAQALGAEGVYIEDPAQLGPSIERGLESDTVFVIHVPTQLAGVSHWEGRFGKCA
jgi:acetolactate synthase-1/2/3 large subunit